MCGVARQMRTIEGTYLAKLDSGIDTDHPGLMGKYELPALSPGYHLDTADHDQLPEDAYGHGTFIAGIIGQREVGEVH